LNKVIIFRTKRLQNFSILLKLRIPQHAVVIIIIIIVKHPLLSETFLKFFERRFSKFIIFHFEGFGSRIYVKNSGKASRLDPLGPWPGGTGVSPPCPALNFLLDKPHIPDLGSYKLENPNVASDRSKLSKMIMTGWSTEKKRFVMSSKKFYAVRVGQTPGIYQTWKDCQAQVHGVPGCIFKSFFTEEEARSFLDGLNSAQIQQPRNPNAHTIERLSMETQTKVTSISEVSVYTDGACEGNGQKGSRGGVGVWWGDGHPNNISKPLDGLQTNNRAELTAVLEALKMMDVSQNYAIYTDSTYVAKGVKWAAEWKKNNWNCSNGKPAKNRDLWEEVLTAKCSKKVRFVVVKGHAGIYGNVQADRLAVNGILR
jgi:ribonuclease HI